MYHRHRTPSLGYRSYIGVCPTQRVKIGSEVAGLLLPLRLVSHRWNDAIVKILDQTHDISFTKYFRIRRGGQKFPYESDLAIQELDETIMTFTSTASSLKFSRVQFDHFYFMTNSLYDRINLLTEIQGRHIQHLTFDAEYENESFTRNENYEMVTLKCLGSIFKGTPNLQTNIIFKLSRRLRRTRIFPEGAVDLPILEKLIKIEISEMDVQKHMDQFLEDIFLMAPNLNALNIQCFESFTPRINTLDHYMNLFKALGAPQVQIFPNLVNLKLSFPPFVTELSAFGFLKLTTLVITTVQKNEWNPIALTPLLECVKTTLVTLKLGDTSDWVNLCKDWEDSHVVYCMGTFGIRFPIVTESLKTFEVNLVIFSIFGNRLEESQFPVLVDIRIILPIPNGNFFRQYHHHIIKGSQVSSVRRFTVFCKNDMKDVIMEKFLGFQSKFPNAEGYFGSPLEYAE